MNTRNLARMLALTPIFSIGLAITCAALLVDEYKSGIPWKEPVAIDPGDFQKAPSDAIVLFDGSDLSAWEGGDQWKVDEGVATAQKTGITSKQKFGDIQLHLEWASPAEVVSEGQGRGNSGIYLMGKYEVQILDSYENATYFDGQAGSIYKQWPPLVNATRPPGEWQTYDIIFKAPRFDDQGEVVSPAYLTLLHNGVVVQNHTELKGGTFYERPPAYEAHAEKLPLFIQFHGNPVQFRNIWVRELSEHAREAESEQGED